MASLDRWIFATLEAHNIYRELHGVPPLKWSFHCADLAKMQADECAKNEDISKGFQEISVEQMRRDVEVDAQGVESVDFDQTLSPSQMFCGQNIAWAKDGSTINQVVESWYRETNEYPAETHRISSWEDNVSRFKAMEREFTGRGPTGSQSASSSDGEDDSDEDESVGEVGDELLQLSEYERNQVERLAGRYLKHGKMVHLAQNFTQLVWKSTTHVGFAFARGKLGESFFVANYWPAGNVIKGVPPTQPDPNFTENVFACCVPLAKVAAIVENREARFREKLKRYRENMLESFYWENIDEEHLEQMEQLFRDRPEELALLKRHIKKAIVSGKAFVWNINEDGQSVLKVEEELGTWTDELLTPAVNDIETSKDEPELEPARGVVSM